jgi:hypothetical protein
MQKRTRIKLLIISAMFFAATAINTRAQTQDDGSAKSSPTTQAAVDDVCNRRLAKTLDALAAAELTVKNLQAAIEAQSKLLGVSDELISKKDKIIKSQSDLIKNYDKDKGVSISFFFGLLKIRKR